MEFSDFAQRLKPIIGGGASIPAFTKSLFDAIVDEAGSDIVDNYQPTTYKQYYSGDTQIGKISQRIRPYLDSEEFVSYLKQFNDDCTAALSREFSEFCPDITILNFAEEITDLFVSIINAAAEKADKRSPRNHTASEVEEVVFEAEVVAYENEDSSSRAKPNEHATHLDNQTTIIQNGNNNVAFSSSGVVNINL